MRPALKKKITHPRARQMLDKISYNPASNLKVLQNVSVKVLVGSVVEWLKGRTLDQHGLGSKPTRAILLCPWERHFMALSPAWWS